MPPGVDLGPGETFGERGLVGPADLPVAVALTDVRCQVLSRHDFDPSAPLWSKVVQSYQPRLPARPKAHVWVPQLEPTDCGLAALAMVGLRLGAPVSVEELRAKVTPGPAGADPPATASSSGRKSAWPAGRCGCRSTGWGR